MAIDGWLAEHDLSQAAFETRRDAAGWRAVIDTPNGPRHLFVTDGLVVTEAP
jgi:hypothetical protein